jgi:hypothetical protein
MFNFGLRGIFVGFEARVPKVGFCNLAILAIFPSFTSIVLGFVPVRDFLIPFVGRKTDKSTLTEP